MRIVIAGAHGQIARQFGRLVVQAGHDAVGMVRKPEHVPDLQADGVTPAMIDLEDTSVQEMTEVVRGADAVVSAISPRPNARGLPQPKLAENARALIAGLRQAGTRRVLYVGGASTLEIAPGRQLLDEPSFPEAYKAEGLEGREALGIWRTQAEVLDWTILSPAMEI